MTEYLCVIRGRHGSWVTASSEVSESRAKCYGESFGSVVALIARRPGICPPVGMRSHQASHCWEWLGVQRGLPYRALVPR